MRIQNMLLVCGTMCSMMVAGHVGAQPNQPDRPRTTPTTQPSTTTTTQPTDRTITPPARLNNTARNNSAAPTLLREMEGVWRVEVMCSADHWKSGNKHTGMDSKDPLNRQPSSTNNDRTTDHQNTDRDRATNDGSAPRSNADDPSIKDPFQRSEQPGNTNQPATRTDAPRTNPNRTPDANQPGGLAGAKTYVGYAETKLVMGDNILQQNVIIPDMQLDGTARDAQRIDGAGVENRPGDNQMFRGMSFLAFDAENQQYSCVFMDSRNGQIHCDHGTYDESARRLVFNGREGNSHTGQGNNADNRAGMHDKNVRVVVELLSPTQHRVTMYKGGDAANTTRTTTTPSSPAQPGQANQPNQPNQQRDINNTGRPLDNTNTALNNMGEIIYQATYTKAANDEAVRFRRLLHEPGSTNLNDRPGNTDRNTDNDRPGNRIDR